MRFIQIESQFQCNRINTDSTKYHYLVAALDADTMMEVADVLQNPVQREKYAQLKAAIIQRFTDSADRQLTKALTELELGDRKPSQLLRQMSTLAGDRASEDVLRVRWIALLPQPIQRCLKVLRSTSLEEQAIVADELLENGSGPFIMSTSLSPAQSSSTTWPTDSFSAIARELSDIKSSLAELITCNKDLGNQLRSNQRGRSRSRTIPRNASPSPGGMCYYHRRFGNGARRCIPPCSFEPSQTGN